VYSFATVAMLLCIAAVGFYIYIVRLPIGDYVNRGKDIVKEGEKLVRESREAKRAIDEMRNGIERLSGSPGKNSQSVAQKPDKPAVQKDQPNTPSTVSDPSQKPESKPETASVPKEPAEKTTNNKVAQTPETAKDFTDTAPPKETIYEVKARDSLYAIAKSNYGNGEAWKKIAEANGIKAPYTIRPGMKLHIPELQTSSTQETAQKADTPLPGEKLMPVPTKENPVYLTGGRGL